MKKDNELYIYIPLIMAVWASFAMLLFVAGCKTQEVPPSIPDNGTTAVIEKPDCSLVEETLALSNQTVKLPATGKFVLESHLAAIGDFPAGKWPKSVTEGIDEHLARGCVALMETLKIDISECKKWYANQYVKQWTPSEGGNIAQGSISKLPTVEQEMWSGNMMWSSKTKPAPGTKFLATHNGKSVVVSTGWETGPGDKKWLGGLQGEVMYALGANNSSQIRWGKLKNQQLKLGPIDCK